MRVYAYVGPAAIRDAVKTTSGQAITTRHDLLAWVSAQPEPTPVTATFVVDDGGVLRVAPRRSEHVACAGGADVLAAGELTVGVDGAVVEMSNQSTGYCPEPACVGALVAALDAAGIAHPGELTAAFVFRRCEACGERNLVKDDWYVCDLCGAELPERWNFA